MSGLLRVFPILVVLAGLALLLERPAYAYVDPGTGLLAVQAVGSALIAAGWYLRRKIASFLHFGSAPKSESEQGAPKKEVEG